MTTARIARMLLVVFAAFIVFGPLSGLVIWSMAEKWYWPHLLPQQVGTFYWEKVFQGRMMQALEVGVLIAIVVTTLSLVCTVPLAYVLARYNVPFKPVVLMVFMLPQAFPQLPVFVNATVFLYRVNLAGKVPGVVLIHMVGALVYAVWTMTAVFKSIPVSLEEAAINLGASRLRTFLNIPLRLALPGIISSGLLIFLYSLDEFTGTLLVGSPFVLTLPVFMYNASQGYELPVASITALLLMVPGIVLLVVLERYLKAEYLSSFGRI